jgi:predicted amidohydrolase YtcJ
VGLLIRNARVAGRVVCVRAGDTISHVGANQPPADDDVLDVDGAPVIVGLHDHHVHLLSMAAAAESVPCGPPEVVDASGLQAALAARHRALPRGEWIRGVGYHESVAGLLDRRTLDELLPDRPVRVQHRSGILWVLNSAALREVGADVEDGRLWRQDEWLRSRLPKRDLDLSVIGAQAAAWGITGFTDATPATTPDALTQLAGQLPQRLYTMASPEANHPGPAKVLLDDDRLPSLDELLDSLGPARRAGRALSFHCVTHVQAALALAALEELGAGPGDRIEHGALLNLDQVKEIGRLGVTVVTQPGLVHSRGDRYLEDVDEQDDLWRLGSLLTAGVSVAAGSDAPFGPADPWLAVEAATTRRTAGGRLLGPQEALSFDAAVGLFQGRADRPAEHRTVEVGQPGDLCVIGPDGVESTIVAGRLVYER